MPTSSLFIIYSISGLIAQCAKTNGQTLGAVIETESRLKNVKIWAIICSLLRTIQNEAVLSYSNDFKAWRMLIAHNSVMRSYKLNLIFYIIFRTCTSLLFSMNLKFPEHQITIWILGSQ